MGEETRIDINKLRRAILAYLEDNPQESRRSLSLKASDGRNPDVIRDIFRVDKRQPLYDTVANLAAAIGRDVSEFVAGTRPKPEGEYWLTVSFAVEAGAFRQHADWARYEWFQIEIDPPADGAERHGAITRGESMNRVFPPGTILECVDLISSGIEFESGDYVIVERRRGDLVETTVKKAVRRADGSWELHAESWLPDYREPIVIGKPGDTPGEFDEDREVRVKALVMDARLPLKRRRVRSLPDAA